MSQRPTFDYRGYRGVIDFDRIECTLSDDGITWTVHGRVDGIREVVTFIGEGSTRETTVVSADKAFRASVDAYLSRVAEPGDEPKGDDA